MNKKNLFISIFCLTLILSASFLIQNNIVNGEEIENVNDIENIESAENVENIESEITEDDIIEWQGEMGDETESENGESFSDYYKFGSIKVDLQSERASYVPGDKIKFSGTIANTNFYPIINGELYVRIFQENETNARENGDYVIDEFFVLENINLMPSGKKNVNFNWDIPSTAFKGNYKLATFFTVDKKYNMSGLSFASNVYASFCTFEIKGNNQGRIIFDRNNTKFNDEPYLFRSYIPQITSKDKAEISIPLNNTYGASKDIRINYDLYYWDALLEENKVKSDSEDIIVGSSSYRTIRYSLDELDLSVYLLKITAISKTDKSIIDIRFGVSDIPLARINYAGITKFPIVKGEKAKAFVCFHGTNDSGFNGKIDLDLKDNEGNIIASKSYQGNITGDVMVETVDINAGENLNLFNLESKLSDANGKVIDSFSKTYNISKLSPGYIEKTSEKENNAGIYLIAFSLIIILITIYFIRKKNLKPIFVFVLLLVGISLIYLIEDGKKETEIIQAEEGVGKFSQTIGKYTIGKGDYFKQPPIRLVKITSFLEVNYELFLKQGDKILKNGDKINSNQPIEFVFNKDGEWLGTGSNWDTPPPYWVDSKLYPINDPRTMNTFQSLPKKGCEAINFVAKVQRIYKNRVRNCKVFTPLIIKNPSYQLKASNNVNCVGNICNIIGSGKITISATIGKTYFQQIMAHNDRPFSMLSKNCYYYTNLNINRMKLNNKYHDKLPIQSVTKTWNFIVEESEGPIAQIQCSTSDCTTFENRSFALLNRSYDNKTPDDKLKSVWIITGINNDYYQRTECENKCNYTTRNLPIGDYSAYLRIEDEDDLSDETTKTFKIKEDMEIGFQCSLDNIKWESCSSISALINQEVFFKDISQPSTGANINARNWTFRDGNPDENKGNNEINPSAEFISEGTKEILLQIKDSVGRAKTASENIKVFLTKEDIIKAMPNWKEVTPKW